MRFGKAVIPLASGQQWERAYGALRGRGWVVDSSARVRRAEAWQYLAILLGASQISMECRHDVDIRLPDTRLLEQLLLAVIRNVNSLVISTPLLLFVKHRRSRSKLRSPGRTVVCGVRHVC